MTNGERSILTVFRNYGVKAHEMLFINSVGTVAGLDGPQFTASMNTLVNSGLVRRDRRQHSYHLTQAGYHAAMHPATSSATVSRSRRKLRQRAS